MTVIADAGPLLHLHWVGASAWALPPQKILVVEAVWREVAYHETEALNEPRLRRTPTPQSPPDTLETWSLDAGEKSALACALALPPDTPTLILCDEMQARRACRTLGLPVIGSIGLIVEAARAERATRLQAVAALEELPRRGRLHVKAERIAEAISAINAL